jgi:aldose 1-epimerase
MSPASENLGAFDESVWGEHEGRDVKVYTLENANGLRARVTNFGAILTQLHVPDRAGRFDDVVLGFDELEPYVKGPPFIGSTVGRVAGRIANSRFALDGREYRLRANDGPHHLHGGPDGWFRQLWQGEARLADDGPSVTLRLTSRNGDEGYPGTVVAKVEYTLTDDDALRVRMTATTDRRTLINVVHHSYWNLSGHGSGSIEEHCLTLHAGRYTPAEALVPLGQECEVHGTPFDFTVEKTIGRDLQRAGGDPVGYDHNWIVDGEPGSLRPVARLRDPSSGRVMTIEANQPAVQFYAGNQLDGTLRGKGGVRYQQYGGLCLETQRIPNAINVPAWSRQMIQDPRETYDHSMIMRFGTD